MSKHIEKLKKQLLEISEVVNSFRSEAVQVLIIDRLLDAIVESDKRGYLRWAMQVQQKRAAKQDLVTMMKTSLPQAAKNQELLKF